MIHRILYIYFFISLLFQNNTAITQNKNWKKKAQELAVSTITSVIILTGNPICAKSIVSTKNDFNTQQLRVSLTKEKKEVKLNENDFSFLNGLASGAAVRSAKEIVLHPIETVKARVQTEIRLKNETKNSNLINIYTNQNLYKNVYNGLIPSLIGGIPAGALFFGVKDFLKNYLKSYDFLDKQEITIIGVILANIPYWLLRTPSEYIKTQDQVYKSKKEQNNDNSKNNQFSSWDNINNLIEKEGIYTTFSFIYRSFLSNLVYALPADIIKFVAYEQLIFLVLHKDTQIKGLEAAVFGAFASLIAQLSTTPLDVIRTRIMSISPNLEKSNKGVSNVGIRNITREIYLEEGLSAFFSGTTPRAFRAIVSGAVQFASYEISQNFLNN